MTVLLQAFTFAGFSFGSPAFIHALIKTIRAVMSFLFHFS